ncbi:MAG: YicC/YloC family endoribonuclease [Cardiobacteriaceae bacterium]|nr:YicC/YloC family endoribonuclease [Cardiobacteriaceae bacterium]
MMLQSMTAFARRSQETPHFRLALEIRSVNNRFLELNVRMPEILRHLENDLRQKLQTHIKRGKIDLTIYLEQSKSQDNRVLNTEALKNWVDTFNSLPEQSALLGKPTWHDVLSLPNVWQVATEEVDWAHEVSALFEGALSDFIAMREREGEKIARVLLEKLNLIEQHVLQLKTHLPELEQHIRQNILQRFQELQINVDGARLEQEMVFLLAKSDVAEELDRLQFHSQEIRDVLQQGKAQGEAIGRRLDFIIQELHREANTLGSKAADVVLSQASIELKLCIEQMREQVQNLM